MDVVAEAEHERIVKLLRVAGVKVFYFPEGEGIDHAALIREAAELRGDVACGIHNHRVAVENELVVAADGVAIHHGHVGLAGDIAEHFPAALRLPKMKGRGAEVDQ